MTATVVEIEIRLRIVVDLVPMVAAIAPAIGAAVVAAPDPVDARPPPAQDPSPVQDPPPPVQDPPPPVQDPPPPVQDPPPPVQDPPPSTGGGSAAGKPVEPPLEPNVPRSPEQRAQAVERYLRGEGTKSIADDFRVTTAAVLLWVKKAGHERRPSAAVAASRAAAKPAADGSDGDADPPPAPQPVRPPVSARPAPVAALPPAAGARDPDAEAIAQAVAAGRVRRMPDPAVFAALPGVPDSNAALAHLVRLGRKAGRSGPHLVLDGKRMKPPELMAAATAALRDEAMRNGAGGGSEA